MADVYPFCIDRATTRLVFVVFLYVIIVLTKRKAIYEEKYVAYFGIAVILREKYSRFVFEKKTVDGWRFIFFFFLHTSKSTFFPTFSSCATILICLVIPLCSPSADIYARLLFSIARWRFLNTFTCLQVSLSLFFPANHHCHKSRDKFECKLFITQF